MNPSENGWRAMKSILAFGKCRFGCLVLVAVLVFPGHLFAGDFFASQNDEEPEYTTGEYLGMGVGAIVVAGLIIHLAVKDIRKTEAKENYTPIRSSDGFYWSLLDPMGLFVIRW